MGNITNSTEDAVTLEMIAREAGVSPSTVSRILNGTARVSEMKRKAVEQTIERYNFQPNAIARGLAKGRTYSIGVLTQFLGSPFYGEGLRGIEEALQSTGFAPLFVSGHWDLKDEIRAMTLLQSRRVDGIIVMTGKLSDQHLIEYAQRLPIVITGRDLEAPNLVSLNVNDYLASYQATQHLIELGHTRIAYISGPEDHPDSVERLRGYRDALENASLTWDPNLVVQADFHEAGGVLAINQLVNSRQGFTAVFAANDQMAYGVRLGLYRLNIRVPEDISLVGFDDLPNSIYTMPPLTTIRQPIYDVGRLAAELILKMIGGEEVQSSKLQLELVVRESTRRIYR